MKKIITLALIVNLFMSCSRSENNEIKQDEIPVLPVRSENGISGLEVFTYKNINEITEIKTATGREVYTYEGSNIVKVEYYEGNKLVQTTQYIYSNDRVIRDISTYDDGNKRTYYYEWKSDNHLRYMVVSGQGTNYNEIGDMYYENGNLVKKTTVHTSGPYASMEIIFTYDNYNNPYANIKGYDKINKAYSFVGKNNMKTSSSFQLTGMSQIPIGTKINTYTYTPKNFPETKLEKYTDSKGDYVYYTGYQYNK